jgi:uncharacterized membrane protein YkvA (DUF1232 family)
MGFPNTCRAPWFRLYYGLVWWPQDATERKEPVTVSSGGNSPVENKTGLIAYLVRNLRLAWGLLLDARVPLLTKLIIPGLMALYILSPIDIIPDVLVGLGQLDDLAVLVLAVKLFIELSPREVVQEHLRRLAGGGSRPASSSAPEGEVVDGEYRVIG